MPFIEERVSRIIGERCRSGPRNVPESNLGRSDPQQTSEGAHIQKSQQSELLGLLVLYRKEKKESLLSPSMHTHILPCLRIVGPQPLFLSQKVAQHNKVQVQQLISY